MYFPVEARRLFCGIALKFSQRGYGAITVGVSRRPLQDCGCPRGAKTSTGPGRGQGGSHNNKEELESHFSAITNLSRTVDCQGRSSSDLVFEPAHGRRVLTNADDDPGHAAAGRVAEGTTREDPHLKQRCRRRQQYNLSKRGNPCATIAALRGESPDTSHLSATQ